MDLVYRLIEGKLKILLILSLMFFISMIKIQNTNINVRSVILSYNLSITSKQFYFKSDSFEKRIDINNCNSPLITKFIRDFEELKSDHDKNKTNGALKYAIRLSYNSQEIAVFYHTKLGIFLRKAPSKVEALSKEDEKLCRK